VWCCFCGEHVCDICMCTLVAIMWFSTGRKALTETTRRKTHLSPAHRARRSAGRAETALVLPHLGARTKRSQGVTADSAECCASTSVSRVAWHTDSAQCQLPCARSSVPEVSPYPFVWGPVCVIRKTHTGSGKELSKEKFPLNSCISSRHEAKSHKRRKELGKESPRA
jgi:hypothetical protein